MQDLLRGWRLPSLPILQRASSPVRKRRLDLIVFEVPCVLWQGFSDAFFPGRPGHCSGLCWRAARLLRTDLGRLRERLCAPSTDCSFSRDCLSDSGIFSGSAPPSLSERFPLLVLLSPEQSRSPPEQRCSQLPPVATRTARQRRYHVGGSAARALFSSHGVAVSDNSCLPVFLRFWTILSCPCLWQV